MKQLEEKTNEISDINTIVIKNGITSFDDFKKHYFEINAKGKNIINGRLRKLYTILEYIKDNEEKDPIKYLYYQYYIEEKSSIDLYDKYHIIAGYSNKNKDNFIKIFKKILGWKLRDVSISTQNTRKKISKTTHIQMQPAMEAKEKTIKKVEKILKKIQKKDNKNQTISKEELNKIKNIFFRTIAVLQNVGINIRPEDIITFSEKYGTGITAKAVKNILEENGFGYINFNKARISEYKNKK